MKPEHLFAIGMFLLLLFAPAAAEGELSTDQRIPLEAFARLPKVHSVQLSPDGKYVAMLTPIRGTTFLVTQKLYSKEKPALVVRNEKGNNQIRWYKWANDERLLVSVGFAGSRGGVPIQESRLVAVNRDGSDLKNIVEDQGSPGRPVRWETQFRDKVISLLPDDRKHILIGLDHGSPGFDTAYYLNIYTGQRKPVQRSIQPIRRWMADNRGNIRVGMGFRGARIKILLRGSRSRKWVTAWEYKMPDGPAVSPMGFGADPDLLYIRYNHEGRQAVFTVDTSKETLEKTLVYSDPEEDIDGALMVSSKTNEAQ